MPLFPRVLFVSRSHSRCSSRCFSFEMEEGEDFSLCEKPAVTEANLRDEYYWKLVADFIGPQSGEGLDLDRGPCQNRLLIQVGLFREDNNFPWIAVVDWLKKIFPDHHSADFRRLIETGIATTLSLGRDARLTFLETEVNFNFVGPICDSIGVERVHLLGMRDFSERAQSIEVTNGLILELSNFVAREKIAPVILVTWLRNFNPEFCKDGDVQKAYKVLRSKIKKLKLCCRNHETRRHRRNAAMENLLQSPFELVKKRQDPRKFMVKKRTKKDNLLNIEKVVIKEEYMNYDITPNEEMDTSGDGAMKHDDFEDSNSGEETSDNRGESLTLLDIAMLSIQKLSSVYRGKTTACKQVSLDLLRNQYALTLKEHPALAGFEKRLGALREDVSLASPVLFLHHNANFLVDVYDAVEQQIIVFENEITRSTEDKLGRDRLPKFRNFVNLQESATSRYINMACDILSPCTQDRKNYRKHWVAFCEEKDNPSRLSANRTNRFSSYFEAAAGLVHHHNEVALFFSDLLSLNNDECPNVVLESVAADAADSVIQGLVCVLAVVYCKIIGPYWQLLRSEGEYSLYGQFMLGLYQKFLDWSKDPSTLLEPEGAANVFLQFPLQERTFNGIFTYCGHWHTNRDLIRACLKRTIKVIAAVTEEHLKDFLPGGQFSKTLSPDVSSQLASCTFSILMAEYPYGHEYQDKKKRRDKSAKRSARKRPSSGSVSSQEDTVFSDSSEASEPRPAKKSPHIEKHADRRLGKKEKPRKSNWSRPLEEEEEEEEERQENMDRDYIVATVHRNGGPCKTQQDVDKMLLRFDGRSRAEKREGIRCEILYQKMVLNNNDRNLGCVFRNSTHMVMKLKLALPRIRPGYSLVLAPRKTKVKRPIQQAADAAPAQPSESSST